MPVDETLINKRSEEVTGEDVRALLNAPSEEERPLIDPGVFDEKQPAQPIYKSIPLKLALAGVAALVVMVPTIRLFSGNLLSGAKPTPVAPTEKSDAAESEEEKAQRLTAEENADLKRKLALQNQSFTAQEIEEAAGAEGSAPTQRQPPRVLASSSPLSQQSVPVSRPVSAVASRPAPVRSDPVRPAQSVRAIASSRPTTPAASNTAEAPPQPPVNLDEIAAAGDYGQLPSRALPVASTGSIPSFTAVANQDVEFSRAGSIPVSVRSQARAAATEAVFQDSSAATRPVPTIMKDVASSVSPAPKEEISPNDKATYEAQRDLIMSEPAALRNASTRPSLILPGSTAQLKVTTAVTWASDLPRALGSVTLVSPLISDGVETLPEGTELIVQIGELSASGAVSLDVVAMVLPGSNAPADISIPAGALEILASNGGYPVARAEQSSEQQLQAIDRQQALLGAMGAAGDYLNRPQRETSVFGLGGSSSSREYGAGSLWGSLLSGAANEMLRSRASRLDAEAEKLTSRPTIWSIESGRQLQLFVTQEIAL